MALLLLSMKSKQIWHKKRINLVTIIIQLFWPKLAHNELPNCERKQNGNSMFAKITAAITTNCPVTTLLMLACMLSI